MESPHGWIKLWRELLHKSIWINSTPEQIKVLMYIIMRASHKEKQWDWNGQQFSIKPGQFICSLESIKRGCGRGVSLQNVRTALKRFEKMQFLTRTITKHGQIITVINWEAYQSDNNDDQHTTSHTSNTPLTTIKNVKNVKKEEGMAIESLEDYLKRIRYFFRGPQSDYLKSQYKTMFPALDVESIWDKCFIWLNDNADNLKKRRENLRTFVTTWMKREQAKAGENGGGGKRKGEL